MYSQVHGHGLVGLNIQKANPFCTTTMFEWTALPFFNFLRNKEHHSLLLQGAPSGMLFVDIYFDYFHRPDLGSCKYGRSSMAPWQHGGTLKVMPSKDSARPNGVLCRIVGFAATKNTLGKLNCIQVSDDFFAFLARPRTQLGDAGAV